MDLSFSLEDLAFRDEVRSFLRDQLPAGLRQRMSEGRVISKSDLVEWQQTLNARGWATPSWPKAWGGPGWSPVQRHIFLDELHSAPAPEPLSFNVSMLGPVLIEYGSEEQKQRFLPRAANLDDWWAQGFSEPGAGSDLAALRTSAVRSGDDYVVNGQKIWQGMAQHADWMFTLVRTDPSAPKRQMGITFLLIDLRSPGISIRPIITMDGRHEVNEVFLDDVSVPVANRVGLENQGWTYAKFLLSNERTGIARLGMTKRLIARARACALQLAPAARDDILRHLAHIEAGVRVLEITQLRILAAQQPGVPDPRSSILKVKGVELRQAASEILLQAAGPQAYEMSYEGHDEAPMEAAANFLTLRAASIYGGASEVQKTILAKSVLGL